MTQGTYETNPAKVIIADGRRHQRRRDENGGEHGRNDNRPLHPLLLNVGLKHEDNDSNLHKPLRSTSQREEYVIGCGM